MKLTSLLKSMVLLAILLTTATFEAKSQTAPFDPVVGSGLPNLSNFGACAWADINNDGFQDVIMTGLLNKGTVALPNYVPFSGVFTNNRGNGTFKAMDPKSFSPLLPRVLWSTVTWIDYNNDGWLDLFISGDTLGTNQGAIMLYKNNGNNTFTSVPTAVFKQLSLGEAVWSDLNLDGYPDLVVMGNNQSAAFLTIAPLSGFGMYGSGSTRKGTIYVYRNNGDGTFTDMGLTGSLFGAYLGGLAVWDMDGDGYPDIAWKGNNNSSSISCFKNMGATQGAFKFSADIGSTTNSDANVSWRLGAVGGSSSNSGGYSFKPGDFDNDGKMDFVWLGQQSVPLVVWNNMPKNADPDKNIFQYRGAAAAAGAPINATVLNGSNTQLARTAHVAVGDYDNDGFLDILVQYLTIRSGSKGDYLIWTGYNTKLYHNKGNKGVRQFEEVPLPASFGPTVAGPCSFVDFNNDGKLDIFYYGAQSMTDPRVGGKTYLGINTSRNSASLPNSAPEALQISQMWTNVQGNKVTFNWRRPNDSETPNSGLTYNIRIGTAPGKGDIIMPSSDTSRGKPTEGLNRLGGFGAIVNTTSDTVSYTISGLSQRNYYWNVQAVDGMYAGGLWAAQDILFGVTSSQAHDIAISKKTENSFRINWGNGTQSRRAVFLYKVAYPNYPEVTTAPLLTDNHFYRASSDLSQQFPVSSGSGWVCVYNRNDPTFRDSLDSKGVLVYNLDKGGRYLVSVVEYDNVIKGAVKDTSIQGFEKYFQAASASKNPIITNTLPDVKNINVLDTIKRLPLLANSIVAWGDYDKDGKLDVAISGVSAQGDTSTYIYKNDGDSTFTKQASINLPGIVRGSLEWGDYNNDGWLDLLITGATPSSSIYGRNKITRLYKGNGTNFTLVSTTGLPDVGMYAGGSCARFADVNNDGLLDVVIAGRRDTVSRITQVYTNTGNSALPFKLLQSLTGMDSAMISLADLNNDGYVDMVLAGTGNYAREARVYYNAKNGTFVRGSTGITGMSAGGSISFSDYDKDGYLDMTACGGVASTGGVFGVYHNNAGASFSAINITENGPNTLLGTPAFSLTDGACVFTDYDNDGWSDVLVTGSFNNAPSTRVFRNNQGAANVNAFSAQTGLLLPSVKNSTISLADYNNNGIKEIYITGIDANGKIVGGIYTAGGVTAAPANITAPKGLFADSVNLCKGAAVLKWTAVAGARGYNIRLYRSDLKSFNSVMADTTTGRSYINIQQGSITTNRAVANNVTKDIIKWRVQAYDAYGNVGSWSKDTAFTDTTHYKQVSGLVISNQTSGAVGASISNSAVVTWVNGNNDHRVVFAALGTPTGPMPLLTDGTDYTANSVYGSGTLVPGTYIGMGGWYCVYNGSGNTVTVNNLDPSKVYSFAAFECSSAFVYNTSVNSGNLSYTYLPPVNNAISVSAIVDARRKLHITWSSPLTGGGTSVAGFIHVDNASGATTKNDTTYRSVTANTLGMNDYAQPFAGTQIYDAGLAGTGWYCIFNRTKRPNSFIKVGARDSAFVQLRDIYPSGVYSVKVCEYNGIEGSEKYNWAEVVGLNPVSTSVVPSIVTPTLQDTGINFVNVTSTQLTMNTGLVGNGRKRAVFMCASPTVSSTPATPPVLVNGTQYPASSVFKDTTINTAVPGAPGWYCVFNGTGTLATQTVGGVTVYPLTVKNLTQGTSYTLYVSEYDGYWDSGNEMYNNTSAYRNPWIKTTDYVTPVLQSKNLVKTDSTTNSISVQFQAGSGLKHYVLITKGSTGDVKLSDNAPYTANSVYGASNSLVAGSSWYCVYADIGNTCTITGLLGDATTYRIKVIEMNGALGQERYLNQTNSDNIINISTMKILVPTVQSSNLVGTINDLRRTDNINLSWTRGNGDKCVVFVKEGTGTDFSPLNNTTYTANSTFKSGTALGNWYCVYNGTDASLVVNGLKENTKYSAVVFEYSGVSTIEKYITTTGTNATSFNTSTTILPPFVQATSVVVSPSKRGAILNWTNGSGLGSAVFVSGSNASATVAPTNDVIYTANTLVGSGDQIVSGWYCVYNGTSNTATIRGLVPGATYKVKVFSYNSNTDLTKPKFITSDTLLNPVSFTTSTVGSTPPVCQTTNLNAVNVGALQFDVTLTGGDGDRRVVFVTAGSDPKTFVPVNNTVYSANAQFGKGVPYTSTTVTGRVFTWYCVYNGSATDPVTVTGLTQSRGYTVASFEYNTDNGAVLNYKSDTIRTTAGNVMARFTAPTKQASSISFTPASTSINVGCIKGNGNGRAIFLHEGHAAKVPLPVQFDQVYAPNATFKTGDQVGSSGWYCVYSDTVITGTSVNVNGLVSTQWYTARAVEYNISFPNKVIYNVTDTTLAGKNPKDTLAMSTIPTIVSNQVKGYKILDSLVANPGKLKLTWNRGDAQNYLVVMGPNDKVSVKSFNSYSANAVFGSGSVLNGTWYAVYSGPDSTCVVSNLVAEKSYKVLVFPYNGPQGGGTEQYLKVGVEVQTVNTDYTLPLNQASLIRYVDVQPTNGSFGIDFHSGTRDKSYAKAIVLMSKSGSSAATLPIPLHNHTYTASDSFDSPTASVVDGWQVMYNGTDTLFDVKGVNAQTEYKVMVCEYRGVQGLEKYNRSMEIDNPNLITPALTTGMVSVTNKADVKVYPNPVRDVVNIEAKAGSAVTIYSLDGSPVKQVNLNSDAITVNMSSYANGIYLFKVKTDKGVFIKQIVKQ